MSLINVSICKGRACVDRGSEYIEKRLRADQVFYIYNDDVEITGCTCQGRCKEGPIVTFGNDTHAGQNPVKSSEMLRKKVEEARKRFNKKAHA